MKLKAPPSTLRVSERVIIRVLHRGILHPICNILCDVSPVDIRNPGKRDIDPGADTRGCPDIAVSYPSRAMDPFHLWAQGCRGLPRQLVRRRAPTIQDAAPGSETGPRAHGDEILKRGEPSPDEVDGLGYGWRLRARALATWDEQHVEGGCCREGVGGHDGRSELGGLRRRWLGATIALEGDLLCRHGFQRGGDGVQVHVVGTRQEAECVQGAKQVQLLEGWEDDNAEIDWLGLCILYQTRAAWEIWSVDAHNLFNPTEGASAGEGIREGLTELSHVSKLPTTGFPGREELERLRGSRSEQSA